MRRQVSTVKNSELLSRLDSNSLLIDVREPSEYQQGHIPQAVNIPLGTIETVAKNLDKNKIYYVICRSGSRSEMAAKTLMKLGFENVYSVIPGMIKWF